MDNRLYSTELEILHFFPKIGSREYRLDIVKAEIEGYWLHGQCNTHTQIH